MGMIELDKLIELYEIRPSVEIGGVKLFDRDSAINIVSACRKELVGIIGIEGFIVDGDCRVPRMDWIADFSEVYKSNSYDDYVVSSLRYAIDFFGLDEFDERLVFEVILK